MSDELSRSEVWVLHAALLCANEGVATVSDVIAACDMTNHAIVTWDELNGAILQLRARGLLYESAPFALTETALQLSMEGNDVAPVSTGHLEEGCSDVRNDEIRTC